MLVRENRWRAMRYSFDEGLIDFAKGSIVPFNHLLDELLELTYKDARSLECESEVAAVKDILSRGTSAHRQLKAHESSIAAGKNREDALKVVVDQLISETAEDL
jgi:carboxylate-amine ligase